MHPKSFLSNFWGAVQSRDKRTVPLSHNYLGASVWSILFIIFIGIANIFCGWLSWWALAIALILQVLMMSGCYLLLETRGWSYAKYLFATFTGKNESILMNNE